MARDYENNNQIYIKDKKLKEEARFILLKGILFKK